MINRLHGEVEGHEFNDWAQSTHRRACADAGKAMFSNRRVDHATRAEFVEQSLRYLIGTLIFGDFFTHHENAVVGAHFFGHRIAQRFA